MGDNGTIRFLEPAEVLALSMKKAGEGRAGVVYWCCLVGSPLCLHRATRTPGENQRFSL